MRDTMINIPNIPLFLLYLLLVSSDGKTFTRCDLYRELKRHGFPDAQMRDWICLVEAESSRRTDAVGGPDDDGSFDYGLFQINDRYWCSNTARPGKECHLRCTDLLTDDITKAVECTKQIYNQQGFEAWLGWKNDCRGKLLPDITECFNHYYPDFLDYYK